MDSETDSTEPATDPAAAAYERRWHLIRKRVAIGYLAAILAYSWFVGVPTDRRSLLVCILLGLAIRCLGRGWRSYGRVLLDWLPFTAVLMAYDYSRGIADNLGIAVHVKAPPAFDEWLTGGTLPSYWLQQHLYHAGDPRWYDAIVTITYTSHFLAMPIVAVTLWLRNRTDWAKFIRRILTMSLLGLATYILYPAAPPWYASQKGVVPPLVRLSSRGWFELHMNHAGNLLAGAQAGANAVAAMPSLHTATATIVAFFLIPRVPKWARLPLACYPLLMGAILVYSGEHYVIDLLMGYLLGAFVLVSNSWAERKWYARRDRRRATVDVAPAGAVPVR